MSATITTAVHESTSTPPAATHSEQERAIKQAIRSTERRLRETVPLLKHQTALGMAALSGAYATVLAVSTLYCLGYVPGWLCIVLNAIAISILREVEHDIIHNLYLKGRTKLQDVLLLAIWPMMGNSMNPVYRRIAHLNHHRTSGHEEDLEERLIGNGVPFGWMRLLTLVDPGTALLLRLPEFKSIPGFTLRGFMKMVTPLVPLFNATWYSILVCNAASLVGQWLGFGYAASPVFQQVLGVLNIAAVVWVLPNLLRQGSLQILSSNMHYYGDVHDTMEETQVLNHPIFWPLQLVTFNFGSTHTIHHFAVNQPFYLRQMCASAAHAAMRQNGVRFNDLGSFLRGNRYQTV